ncbi:MAG TPA: type 1 glutamine amidotransferase domain-containing protein [Limnobacter sp.]|nr:type 1 glutamine amidotransferase domain-containing protein [Limnobacter sp.]
MKQKLTSFALALGLALSAQAGIAGNTVNPAKEIAASHTPAKQADKKHRVLVVMTNHSKYPSRDDSTGLWLTELTHFYEVFSQAGIPMDFMSPKGGAVPLDERSLGWLYSDKGAKALLAQSSFMDQLQHSRSPAEVNPADYDVIFFTGGHGTMWDFRNNPELKRVAEGVYRNGGIVSSVCHGAAGLLNLEDANGKPLIAGRRVTGFSNLEEKLSGVESQVPFALQTEMQNKGAQYEKGFLPFGSHVVVDGRLVTGQNPGSSKEVAKAVLGAMRGL